SAILFSFALFIGLEFVYHTLRNCTLFVWNRVAVRSLHDIVTQGFAKVQKFSTDWHANAFAGGTVRKITRGMWAFDVYEDNIVMFMWPTFIVLVSTVTIMFLHWPLLGFITLMTSLAYIGFGVWS